MIPIALALSLALGAGEASGAEARAPPPGPADVSRLPLVLVPARGEERDLLALLVTGDGGWAGIDRDLSGALARAGVPVVGFDSLRWFWRRKTPEETAAAVSRTLAHHLAASGKAGAVLVGYSRGADVLPAIAARLDPAVRARVRAIVLLAPGRHADFEIRIGDFFGGDRGAPIRPELEKLSGTPLTCVYGSDERDETACTQLDGIAAARALELPGGHHFGGDYDRLARIVVGAVPLP